MNPEHTNLRQQHRAEQEHAHEHFQHAQTQNQTQAREFATVDDLLRYDSDQNPVPPEISERLNRSLEAEPKPERPWYKRLFG